MMDLINYLKQCDFCKFAYAATGGLEEIDINNLWNNLNLKISYAIDRGKLLGDSDGYLVSFIYNFSDLSRSH